MSKYCKLLFLLCSLAIVFYSCNSNKKKEEKSEKEKTQAALNIPDFNADSAYFYVEKQIDFGPRVSNSAANKKCAIYLSEKLKSYLPQTIIQHGKMRTFDGTMLNIQNIIASYHPNNANRIMICSHWDSRPFADWDKDPKKHKTPIPGANDGASGVGILIELAKELSISKPDIGVDIILFDAEDYGEPHGYEHSQIEDAWGLGAQYWAENPHKSDYTAKYGILLDMVGAKNATFMMEKNSMFYAPDVTRKVWDIATDLGFANYFVYEEAGAITDDHYYINKIRKLPTIDIIHLDRNSGTGFFPYWHTTKDDMSNIDKQTLKVVGQTLLNVIFREK